MPLIESGSAFTHLVFVQHGTVVPWQSPPSELAVPFMIGVHEFLMETDRWVGGYSAITEVATVRIPEALWRPSSLTWPACGSGCASLSCGAWRGPIGCHSRSAARLPRA